MSSFPTVAQFSGAPASELTDETESVDPFEILAEHNDLSLCRTRLPRGERGRWYPDLHVIVLDDRLTQAEARCTLMHELVHRMRGDVHVNDGRSHNRQEKACHMTVARLLIPFEALFTAMQWGRDPHELAEELFVDEETLRARVLGLSDRETARLQARLRTDDPADMELVS
jgi:Zn-dependent peptidase ImmA (M78 family)